MNKTKITEDSWKEYEHEYVPGAYVMCVSDDEDPYGPKGNPDMDGEFGEIYQITRVDRYGKEAPMIQISKNPWWVSAYRFRPVSISRS